MKIQHLVLGIAAGISIGIGGNLYLLAMANGLNKIIGSLLFPIGLCIICILEFELYTGKIGFFRNKDKDVELSNAEGLFYMLIGNLIGAVMFGYYVRLIYMALPVDNTFLTYVENMTDEKIHCADNSFLIYSTAIIKSILCGACVYLAVYEFKNRKSAFGKLFYIFVFIGFFVYVGWEHCVADMFYFSVANNWSLDSYLWTLACIEGNSIGAIITNCFIK